MILPRLSARLNDSPEAVTAWNAGAWAPTWGPPAAPQPDEQDWIAAYEMATAAMAKMTPLLDMSLVSGCVSEMRALSSSHQEG